MNKTKIEWADYTINPVKGLCPMACPYCYARRMYKRFGWDETIRFEPLDYKKFPDGSMVFVGSTMELFGDWVDPSWLWQIFEWCRRLPKVTFIFLTKQPQNLVKWSPFPDNCWVGVSATNRQQWVHAQNYLHEIEAPVKFYSFEPLLGDVVGQPELVYFSNALKNSGINWIIIGQQTPVAPVTLPRREWIQEIIKAADIASIPVFEKDNLRAFLPFRQHYKDDYHDKCYSLRQEFPVIRQQ
jgi:protein gp37